MLKTFWMVLDYACNNRCPGCYAEPTGFKMNSMNLDYAKSIINTMSNSGIKHCLWIGGEPTLYPNLLKLIHYATCQGIKSVLVTNGRKLKSTKFVQKLFAMGLDRITISVEGSNESVHNTVTGVNSFKDTLTGIKNCVDLGLSVGTITTIQKLNQYNCSRVLKNMSKIIVKFDLEKDAWNWWHACNKTSHGKDWKMSIDKNLRDYIVGHSQEQAFNFLIPYLENFYKYIDIESFVINIQKDFDKFAEKIFERMEKISNNPICHKNILCFITSFPRYPYDYKNGYIWISYKKSIDYQISIFIHELLHFQFFAYYGKKVWAEIGSKKHADLKEAMTIILDEEFSDITSVKDKGYEKHKDLRKVLRKLWLDSKDMDKFIERSINIMKD